MSRPMPTPTLAEAEEIIRSWKLGGGSRMAVLLAEYDRRGAELDQLREEGAALSRMLRGMARKARRYDQIGEQIARLADAEVARSHAHRHALLDALGMDPLRDWDDIVNAARCLAKARADGGQQ